MGAEAAGGDGFVVPDAMAIETKQRAAFPSPPVEADHVEALQRLAASILRSRFASPRVRYLARSGSSTTAPRRRRVARSRDALDWIAQVFSPTPAPLSSPRLASIRVGQL